MLTGKPCSHSNRRSYTTAVCLSSSYSEPCLRNHKSLPSCCSQRSCGCREAQQLPKSADAPPAPSSSMKGIRKQTATSKPPRIRLPITTDIMQGIHKVLSNESATRSNRMMWAACCMAFFGFLRSSEFTVPSQHGYDPETHLSLPDITLDRRNSPTMVCIHIKQSKTDPFRQGVHIYLGRTYQQICPVHAIVSYLAIRGNHPGPVFTFSDGRMLTRAIFGSELDRILEKLSLKVHHYNTHSFRIGAATSAKQAGISDVHIKTLGRWQSDAYQRYIRTPPQQLANLSKMLVHKTLEQTK